MPKAGKKRGRREAPKTLKGWKAIGEYLGIGEASAQRWARGAGPSKDGTAYDLTSRIKQRMEHEPVLKIPKPEPQPLEPQPDPEPEPGADPDLIPVTDPTPEPAPAMHL